jgi:hypothetical protein
LEDNDSCTNVYSPAELSTFACIFADFSTHVWTPIPRMFGHQIIKIPRMFGHQIAHKPTPTLRFPLPPVVLLPVVISCSLRGADCGQRFALTHKPARANNKQKFKFDMKKEKKQNPP